MTDWQPSLGAVTLLANRCATSTLLYSEDVKWTRTGSTIGYVALWSP